MPVLFARLTDECRLLAAHAHARQIRLAFEPEPGMLVATMADYARLHRAVDHPCFGLTMDLGHLFCQREEPIAAHVRQWRDWLWNLHLEDSKRDIHEHLLFGQGEMCFEPIFQALREVNYQGGLHVELSRHSHDAVKTGRLAFAFLTEQLRQEQKDRSINEINRSLWTGFGECQKVGRLSVDKVLKSLSFSWLQGGKIEHIGHAPPQDLLSDNHISAPQEENAHHCQNCG